MSGLPYAIHLGDNSEVMGELAENSVDAIVTDPPYGIRFMGSAWDNFNIEKEARRRDSYPVGEKRAASGRKTTGFGSSIEAGKYDTGSSANQHFQAWYAEKSREMYRVLKPGGHLISFGSTRTSHRMVCGIEDAGFEIRDTLNWIFASGFPKSKNRKDLGLGSALKPAFEPICLARKPLDGTLDQNYAKWGTGYLNIEACKIPGEPWTYGSQPDIRNANYKPGENNGVFARNVVGGQSGRWPANILHDGSEEVLVVFPESDGQQGLVGPEHGEKTSVHTYGDYGPRETTPPRGDMGSAARFFYCAKTSRADRNEGCEHLTKQPLLQSSGTENPGSFQSEGTDKSSQNNHPTVKPTNLMRYLIRLVSPKGGVVLDPFMGSGSTGKAAMYEYCRFIGIDRQPEYIPIAEARIKFALNNRSGQISIF